MSLAETYEDALLEWLFGQSFPTPPAELYLALHRASPPTSATEIKGWSGGDRVRVTRSDFGPAEDSADGHRMMVNTRAIMLGIHSINQNIQCFCLWDAAANGNVVAWGRLSAPLTLTAGDPPIFMTGKLIATAI